MKIKAKSKNNLEPTTNVTLKARKTYIRQKSSPFRTNVRSRSGHFLAELPGILFVLFFFLLFPLINMGSVALGFSTLMHAATIGAHAAATSPTMVASVGGRPSAAMITPDLVESAIDKNNFVGLDFVTLSVVEINKASGNQTTFPNRLAGPANTTNNIYQVQVSVTGTIRPLLTFTAGGSENSSPTIFQPFTAAASANEYAESPSGLHQ